MKFWKQTFEQSQNRFIRLFDEYGIAQPGLITPPQVAAIFRNRLSDALRYLAGPPISEDDLKVLAEAEIPSLQVALMRILPSLDASWQQFCRRWIQSGFPGLKRDVGRPTQRGRPLFWLQPR